MEKVSSSLNIKTLRVAIVYDWLDTSHGGAERLLGELITLFPNACLYTSLVEEVICQKLHIKSYTTSFLQKWPRFLARNRLFTLLFMPLIFENFNFNKYDLVISVSSFMAINIITKPSTQHLAIVLTPSRYLFLDQEFTTPKKFNFPIIKTFITRIKSHLKQVERTAASRASKLIAISMQVRERINEYYHQSSITIYPPFDAFYWQSLPNSAISHFDINEPYYLYVGRLTRFKRVDLLVQTFNLLPEKFLLIVGTGNEKAQLQKLAKNPNIIFLENISDSQLKTLYKNAKALIMPQKEEFGYTALEAQACGTGVICYEKSGSVEILAPHPRNITFATQSISALLTALRSYDIINEESLKYDENKIFTFLEKFSREKFTSQLLNIIKHTSI